MYLGSPNIFLSTSSFTFMIGSFFHSSFQNINPVSTCSAEYPLYVALPFSFFVKSIANVCIGHILLLYIISSLPNLFADTSGNTVAPDEVEANAHNRAIPIIPFLSSGDFRILRYEPLGSISNNINERNSNPYPVYVIAIP